MSELTIPQELIDEASKDSFIGNRLSLSPDHKPLLFHNENNEPIGFQLPGKSKKLHKPMTGSIFISKKHRGKGYATQALAQFLEQHPDGVSFINRKNVASQRAHTKAGWKDSGAGIPGHRNATVWIKKSSITEEDILQGLAGEPARDISPEEVAELVKAYRDNARETTKWHIPINTAGGALAGGGLGALFGMPSTKLLGALVGAGVGGGLGAYSGYKHRQKRVSAQENMGKELGRVARYGLPKESVMHKTASELAKQALAVTEEGHKYDAEAAEIRQRAAEELMALQERFGARGHRDEEGGMHFGNIGKALRLMLNRHPEDPRHMAYAAKKHHEGSNAWNPFGGAMTPTEREGRRGSRFFYGSMNEHKKESSFRKTASQIADKVLHKLALSNSLLGVVGGRAGLRALEPGMTGLQGLHALEEVGKDMSRRAPRLAKRIGAEGGSRMHLSLQPPSSMEEVLNRPEFLEMKKKELSSNTLDLVKRLKQSPEAVEYYNNPMLSQFTNFRQG